MLLAVDPSIRSCGAALFVEGVLSETRVFRLPGKASPVSKVKAMIAPLKIWGLGASVLAIELMQVYRGHKSKGDPNSLVGPLLLTGALIEAFPYAAVSLYKPAEWCGQVPKLTAVGKVADSARTRRILSRLTESEQNSVQLQHDVIDAVGIGLHHLGRLKPRKVVPRE